MREPMYIQAARGISGQNGLLSDALPAMLRQPQKNALYFPDIDYSRWFSIMQLRRMSRLTRAGMATAIETLKDAGWSKPGAIVTGTGKGSLGDTEKFMESIRDFDEGTLNPSPFIQSTYNALNGLIGLHHQVDCYNTTYVHRGFSLELALQDAQLLFREGAAEQVLAGSFEEMTSEHFGIKQKMGYWKKKPVRTEELLSSTTAGTIAGEGCFFFALAKQRTDGSRAKLADLRMQFEPTKDQLEGELNDMLAAAGLPVSAIDLVITGRNGDVRHDHFYDHLVSRLGEEVPQLAYKHLTGEFDTASGFGLWLAAQVLSGKEVPEQCWYRGNARQPVKHILFYNNYFGVQHSLYLLSK